MKFVDLCKSYNEVVDKNYLWFAKPYQTIYLDINNLGKISEKKKLTIESVAAGEQKAPGVSNMGVARAAYYKLERKVPPFLAGGKKTFYFLQIYLIECVHLLKTFSYSTFRGDWDKMRVLKKWLAEIDHQKEAHDAKASLEQSLADIKALGNLDDLTPEEIQLLEAEIKNIEALLKLDSDLENSLSLDDSELLKNASQYLQANEHLLVGLPDLDTSFEYEEPSALDTLNIRCLHLQMMLDEVSGVVAYGTIVRRIDFFEDQLKMAFELQVDVCADVFYALKKAMGSHKEPSMQYLCENLKEALEPFVDYDKLEATYGNSTFGHYLTIENGMPDEMQLEYMLYESIKDPSISDMSGMA